MEERIRPTKSGLFAIELLIAVGVFSLCAAICVGLFVRSEVMSQESADLTRAGTANTARHSTQKIITRLTAPDTPPPRFMGLLRLTLTDLDGGTQTADVFVRSEG